MSGDPNLLRSTGHLPQLCACGGKGYRDRRSSWRPCRGSVWRQGGRGTGGVKTWGVQEGLDRYESHARSAYEARTLSYPRVKDLTETRTLAGDESGRSREDFNNFDQSFSDWNTHPYGNRPLGAGCCNSSGIPGIFWRSRMITSRP